MATSSGELFTGAIPLPSFQSDSAPFTTGQLAVFGEASEATSPTVSGVSPVEGSTLGQFDAVVFDITDVSGIGLAVVLVEYASGECECAYDGSSFTASFENASTVETLTGDGRRFSIKRFGGWKMAPTVRVKAVDTKGNVLS